ncbi:hypothetical protein [Salidesulfovibrio brasiliensis]
MLPFLFILPDSHGALPRTADLAMNGIVISSAMDTSEAEEAHGSSQAPPPPENSTPAPLTDTRNSCDSLRKKRQTTDVHTKKLSRV